MIRLTLQEIVEAVGGQVSGDVPGVSVARVSTDSRSVRADDLFVALEGPNFDGHEFVGAALGGGALGAMVSRDKAAAVRASLDRGAESCGRGVLIEVPDTLVGLGRLAAYHRRAVGVTVIAVVGSNGKTTTKAMIDHILSGRFVGRCSPKSFNNAVGVPLTLLSAEARDDYLVVEIGTNAPGEVASLAAIAQPEMAVITCVAEEHLEGLGSLEGVADEECSVLGCIEHGGFAAVHGDSGLVQSRLPGGGVRVVTFGSDAHADLRVSEIRYEPPHLRFVVNGRFEYALPMAGEHNALNAAGAIAIALRWGIAHEEIGERLVTFEALPMRNEVLRVGGVTVINDAYNANPQSALAALGVLESMPCQGQRIAVLGEMRELGKQATELHRKVALRLMRGNVDRVFLVGAAVALMEEVLKETDLFGPQAVCCRDLETCRVRLVEEVKAGDVVLLKASRAVGLDRLVEPLRAHLSPSGVA